MKNFMEAIESVVEPSTFKHTTNGAVGYSTTNKPLLDLNFAVSSLRKASERDIFERFWKAYERDRILAMTWLFYARDAREGLGERRLFRVIMKELARRDIQTVKNVAPLIAEYGRWDDLIDLITVDAMSDVVIDIVKNQLKEDIAYMKANNPISLLAKWMPSINTSSEDTVAKANKLRVGLGLSHRQYRKTLSALRRYLDVIECKMSARNWEAIDYEAVPSRANLVYNSAFLRNDESRRREYLSALTKGKAKINSSVLFPHDIVHKCGPTADAALEGMWKALPDLVKGDSSTLVVADGSGSMTTIVDRNSCVTALEVANALAIYFAERAKGQFKNKYITFSSRPQLVNLNAGTLAGNLRIAKQHNEVANTNIEATFDLILNTAISNHMRQSDMPTNILIISDMEFDSATNGSYWSWRSEQFASPSKTLFNTIAAKFRRAGYKMPRLVFWNVNSSTGTIPVKENELGVALVSGFSPNVVKMVMSDKLDPWAALVDILNDKRYDAVRNAVSPVRGKRASIHVFDEVWI